MSVLFSSAKSFDIGSVRPTGKNKGSFSLLSPAGAVQTAESPRPLELLSPAKDADTGIAAISAGADAVYIGGPSFGARAAACNSFADIERLCRTAHLFGAKVYMTLNTLLYDKELAEADSIIEGAVNAGVDALIIQDPAVMTMPHLSALELHASTQMNIDTLQKVEYCKKAGFSQLVLPREFSLEKIRTFTAAFPDLRFEVFVSGAMCVSVSGICYISERMTGRSANRGECAQICRLPLSLYRESKQDGSVTKITEGHLLSMKDNMRLNSLEDLALAGASSFKIEGRLKDRSFVVNQTAAFRQKLDEIIAAYPNRFCRASAGCTKINFKPDVSKTFNRGFTSAYLKDDNSDLTEDRTPKSFGSFVGYAEKKGAKLLCFKSIAADSFANGDCFTYFTDSGELEGFRVNRVSENAEVKSARCIKDHKESGETGSVSVKKGGCVYLHLQKDLKSFKGRTALYRNVDTLFLKAQEAKDASLRSLALKATVSFFDGEAKITFSDDLSRSGSAVLKLDFDCKTPLSAEVMCDKLQKTGDSSLSLAKEDISTEGVDQAFMPVSAFNALRRAALAEYMRKACMSRKERVEESKDFSVYTADGVFTPLKELPEWPEDSVDPRLIANAESRKIFGAGKESGIHDLQGIAAKAVMTCRHCLIKTYARCRKDGGSVAGFFIKAGNERFDIVTDCKRCLMYLIPHEDRQATGERRS